MSGTKTSAAASTNAQDQSGAASAGAALAQTGNEIQGQVAGVTNQVRQQATDQISSQKEKLVDTLDTVTLLLRQAGEHAHLQEKALLAEYLDKASLQVGHISETLGAQNPEELVTQAKQFAARQPLLFVGGALAVGFLGTRFLRSSTPPQESTASAADGGDQPAGQPAAGSGKQANGGSTAQTLGGKSSYGSSSTSYGASARDRDRLPNIDDVIAVVDLGDAPSAEGL
jgi:ElaB/YqjD/DUF883 family membrane-anchored ribosome-binding protein